MEIDHHILIVDDDREIRQLVGNYLIKNGFRVSLAANGSQMREKLAGASIDLIILDVMLPGEDGLTLSLELRSKFNVPVLMLSALAEPIDRVLGLEMGADDYLAKPFEPRELVARIRNILRRFHSLPASNINTLGWRFAGWSLDSRTRQLCSPDGHFVLLSGAEYRLLETFLTHPNRPLTRDQLMDMTCRRDSEPFDRSIDLRVSRLRQKLGDSARDPLLIKTLRNEGYLFSAIVEIIE